MVTNHFGWLPFISYLTELLLDEIYRSPKILLASWATVRKPPSLSFFLWNDCTSGCRSSKLLEAIKTFDSKAPIGIPIESKHYNVLIQNNQSSQNNNVFENFSTLLLEQSIKNSDLKCVPSKFVVEGCVRHLVNLLLRGIKLAIRQELPTFNPALWARHRLED